MSETEFPPFTFPPEFTFPTEFTFPPVPSFDSGNFGTGGVLVEQTIEQARFIAYGVPIILTVTLFLQLVLSSKRVAHVGSSARNTVGCAIMYYVSLLIVFLSFFLFWTSAWPYAVVASLFALAAAGLGTMGVARHPKSSFIFAALWVAALIGLTFLMTPGKGALFCHGYYAHAETLDTMCKPEWVLFVDIVAVVVLGASGAVLMAVLSEALAATADLSHV
jgi:hypothetical protein